MIFDIFKADQGDKIALKKLGLTKPVHNEFKFSEGQWNYQKANYGSHFVPKNQQVSEVKLYNEETMPMFENKKDLML